MSKYQIGQALAASYVDERKVSALQFGLLSPETIASMSVAEIKITQIYDQQTFQPNFHAINDPRLGVMDKDSWCVTCKAGKPPLT
jgi:DNA-directed RNA polymerase II subunit RPB1